MSPGTDILIEAEGIEKTFSDGTRALRGVSFSIREGEFVALMGPSGSGKSTLLHILGFLDKPTGGTYKFLGREMTEYSEEELAHTRNKKMGLVFQMFNLLPRTTAFENVKLPLLYSGIEPSLWDDMANNAIESVDLSHRAGYETYQLSGGERQRVAIARALVLSPTVIFADEPTGNLDSKSGQIIMRYIQKLNDAGHTVILVTHETYTAEHADRIIRLHDGEIVSDEKVGHKRIAKDGFEK